MLVDASYTVPLLKVTRNAGDVFADDAVATEEPLEIRITYGPAHDRQTQNVAVTMRTPGHDAELAVGFLFTEGIIQNQIDVLLAQHAFIACAENRENVIVVALQPGVSPNLGKADRNFYTTSSCGVCGKSSISAIRTVSAYVETQEDDIIIDADIL